MKQKNEIRLLAIRFHFSHCYIGMEPLKQICRRARVRGFTALLLLCVLTTIARPAAASPQSNPACPFDFFTNVASRLLMSQMKVNLDHIQIYPTNQYTPAVHRLLQVTANILDATTTNYYPSVFRPLFWKTNEECGSSWQTNIYIAGYQYVQEPLPNNNPPILNTPTDPGDSQIPFGLSGITNNIYGIPWVIGVKKGLPNFNELELDNCFYIQRQLQFNRNSSDLAPITEPFPYGRVYTTNQMYVMGVSNLIGVDDRNSYAENYNDPLTISMRDTLSVTLTNDAGVSIGNSFSTNVSVEIASWPSYAFLFQFGTNMAVIQNLGPQASPPSANGSYAYYSDSTPVTFDNFTFQGPCFIPQSLDSSNFLNSGTPPLPHFGLSVSNWLQAYIIDTDNCILDYVQLAPAASSLDINSAIADPDSGTVNGETSGLWSTNYYGNSSTSWGVIEQYLVSIGGPFPSAEDSDEGTRVQQTGWTTAPIPGTSNNSPAAQQAYFAAFFSPANEAVYDGGFITNITLSILAPFTPARCIIQRTVYAANDPLVHYMSSDLNDFADDKSNKVNIATIQTNGIATIGALSHRYMPWGNVPPGVPVPFDSSPYNYMPPQFEGVPIDNNPFNLSYKDPQVWSSDDWNFPTNEELNASWLGRIHRGTPWQTIYLKSSNILDFVEVFGATRVPSGPVTWQIWTGDINPTDSESMTPIHDWAIAGLLASLFNTNNEASLFSANNPNPNDWENLVNGMMALTNDLPDFVVQYDGPNFATLTISSNSSQAAEIANAIEATRTALPGQLFTTPGNIFTVPQLSDESPFLNWNDAAQPQDGISDFAYEAIPDQLLPLLRMDSIGSMTTVNGQLVIQFTGDDNHAYAVQSSPNLVTWTAIGTNCPVNDTFIFTNNATANTQFYRTILLH